MSAYIAILAAFMRRLDRWLLLRAPMLWRAQPPRSLVLASLAVIVAAIALMPTNIKVPAELDGLASYTVSIRTLLRYGVASTLFVWFQSIVGKPVGELALRRHISTVVAVTIGSFVWLALPTVLMYPQVSAIKRLVLNDQQLSADSEVVSRYRRWDCVPPNVDADEIVKLRTVLAYYSGAAPDLKKEQARSSCKSKDFFSLQPSEPFNSTKDAIDTIREARGYDLWGSPYSWAAVSLGLGVLVAIWSYPTYVWRRTFLKR